ncbi:MAG: DUF2807 domain-containing protein [Blastocatellia bacterium]|nr:DUF2807 domain-containing protein [Blastocatellia bacterium]
MKKVVAIVAIVGVSYVAGCIAKGRTFSFRVKGNGIVKTETRSVPAFTAIDSEGSFDVVVECQKAQNLVVEAEENILPLIETKVEDGTLHIDSKKSFSTRKGIKIVISVPDLNEVELSGSGNISVAEVKTDRFKVDVNGSGNVTVQGATKAADISLSGSGNINTSKLTSEQAQVDLSGSGNIKVFANQEIEGDISGSGNILYAGEPTNVRKHVRGSGDMRKQ